jgi:glycosyltransferase involved in cell wall biosynthesis
MRVAVIHELHEGGAARCAWDLIGAFRDNHEVQFYPRSENETAKSVLEGLSEFRPDVVHCHSFYGNLSYSVLADVANRFPVCLTVHDPRPIGNMDTPCWSCDHNDWCLACPLISSGWRKLLRNPYFRGRIEKRLCHWRCPKGLRVVAPSEWMAGRLREQEVNKFSITTIPNGIDLNHFRPVASNRSRFGLPEGSPVILHVAYAGAWSINHRKGLRHLAEAFVNYVAPRFPSAALAVAGEAYVPNFPNVIPLGMVAQKDLPSLMCSADVFVSPTLADNLSYTILEAMACGRAVVASRVGGVPEQVVDGETGFLVNAGSDADLGQALVRLLSSPNDITRFGAAGRARAERLFGMDKFVRAYETLYKEMIRS